MALYPQLQLDLLIQRLITAPRFSFNELLPHDLPTEGGIYRISHALVSPQLEVYVGKSGNLRRRIYNNHFNGSMENSTLIRKLVNNGHYENAEAVRNFLDSNCAVQFLIVEDERLRYFTEYYAVAILQPPHNS